MKKIILRLTTGEAKRIKEFLVGFDVQVNEERNCLEFYTKGFNGYTEEYYLLGEIPYVEDKPIINVCGKNGIVRAYKTIRGAVNFLQKEFVNGVYLGYVKDLFDKHREEYKARFGVCPKFKDDDELFEQWEEYKKECKEEEKREEILSHIKTTSSGTMATLIREYRGVEYITYVDTDYMKNEWYEFAEKDEYRECWQDSWVAFMKHRDETFQDRLNEATQNITENEKEKEEMITTNETTKKIEVFAVNGTSYEDNTSWVCYNIIDGDSKRYSYEIMDNDFLGERSYEELSELFNSDEELFKKMTEKIDINKIDRSIKHLLEEFNDSENEMFYLDDWYMEKFMHITEEEEKIAYLKNVAKQADELGFADSIEVDEDMMCDDYVVVYGNAPTMVIY